MKTPDARPRGRPRGFDIDQALDCAIGVFWEKGYTGAAISDLAQATGLAPPSLYAAFGSKRGMFLAALKRYGETQGQDPLRALMAAPLSEKAAAFADGAIALTFKGGVGRGCLVACVGAEAAGHDPEIRAAVNAIMRASRQAMYVATAGTDLPSSDVLLAILQAASVQARSGSTPEAVRALVLQVITH
jgi:AcrR family transcriptional regulator